MTAIAVLLIALSAGMLPVGQAMMLGLLVGPADPAPIAAMPPPPGPATAECECGVPGSQRGPR